jgi:hypothetical protein
MLGKNIIVYEDQAEYRVLNIQRLITCTQLSLNLTLDSKVG